MCIYLLRVWSDAPHVVHLPALVRSWKEAIFLTGLLGFLLQIEEYYVNNISIILWNNGILHITQIILCSFKNN